MAISFLMGGPCPSPLELTNRASTFASKGDGKGQEGDGTRVITNITEVARGEQPTDEANFIFMITAEAG